MTDHDEPTIFERVPAQEVPLRTTCLATEKPGYPTQLDPLMQDQLQELQSQNQLLERTLHKRTQQRNNYKARYQALATELTKFKSSGQGFPQLDDSHLTQLVESLRVKIWNFTLYHYDGVAACGRGSSPDHLLTDYTEPTLRSDIDLEYYLGFPDWRPMIVEAFMWKLMVAEIFNKFWWAGITGRSMIKVHAALKPSSRSTAAEIQTFQTWSATTTKMIRESQKPDEPAWSDSHANALDDLVAAIYEAIQPHRTSTRGGLRKAIREILDEAIALDQELSQPLAQFEWDFPWPKGDFDAERMQLAEGEAPTSDGPISIVICPGITKRGRSGDFEKVDLLVPIKVSCAAPITSVRSWNYETFHVGYNRLNTSLHHKVDLLSERLRR
ncbi:hypothetical protein BDW59DRAFT_164764 [Aspergillus cavernicola]|uniref:Uncharacterized protein n=1 Tax=Aspergillus cavernicola TaxID=176166 RepID=A0ABR4HXP0_9EURO